MDDFYKALDRAMGKNTNYNSNSSHQRRMGDKDRLEIIDRCEREMSDPELLQEERNELSRIISGEMRALNK